MYISGSATGHRRKRHPLPKALLKNFIRDSAKREPYPGAPFIVKEDYVSKYGLSVELPEQFADAKRKYDRREEQKRKVCDTMRISSAGTECLHVRVMYRLRTRWRKKSWRRSD